MTVWFTSDTHFGHAKIIDYCERPFDDVEQMNEALIQNWNTAVSASDTIYHLGDFALSGKPSGFLSRLNGRKILIRGNHDNRAKPADGWEEMRDLRRIKVDGNVIVLCHYAMRTWDMSQYGSWQLYGHSHGTLPDDPTLLSIDVGVDRHGYRPISFEEVRRIISTKTPILLR